MDAHDLSPSARQFRLEAQARRRNVVARPPEPVPAVGLVDLSLRQRRAIPLEAWLRADPEVQALYGRTVEFRASLADGGVHAWVLPNDPPVLATPSLRDAARSLFFWSGVDAHIASLVEDVAAEPVSEAPA